MTIAKLSADAQFFYDKAGFGCSTGETVEQGRTRSALNLAAAESFARAAGASFEWVRDSDAAEPNQWGCQLHDSAGGVRQSLWGVDFGQTGKPWGDSYRRVVEAELAAEYMTETVNSSKG